MVDVNMGARALTTEGHATATFLSTLVDFCVDSVHTCLSQDADRRCVPVGLSSLSALLLLLSCFLLVHQRCTTSRGGEHPGGSIPLLYSLLGNVCGTVGAVLSRQLHIQVLMGVSAAVTDAVSFISGCFHVLLRWNSKTERRLRRMRGRRRQHLLSVCVLMVVAGGLLKSRVVLRPADRPLGGGRRLLHAITLQDNTEILGYLLGLLSFIIACTSRFPALCRAYKGQMLTRAYMFSGLLCSLSGALYAAAILLYDTQLGFLLRVMPWLLSAMCCVALDLLSILILWWKRGTRRQPTGFPPDTESLLGGSGFPTEGNGAVKRQRKHQHSSAWAKANNVQKMSEMGRYMDVSVQPAGKVCLKEVMLSKEEVEDRSLNRTVQLVRVDSFCSSYTSCDSSPVGSDLEWDFEESNAEWREPTAEQQEGANLCSCAVLGLPLKTLSGTKLASLAK